MVTDDGRPELKPFECSRCHTPFDKPAGETFCASCWEWVLEVRECRAANEQRQKEIDANRAAYRAGKFTADDLLDPDVPRPVTWPKGPYCRACGGPNPDWPGFCYCETCSHGGQASKWQRFWQGVAEWLEWQRLTGGAEEPEPKKDRLN